MATCGPVQGGSIRGSRVRRRRDKRWVRLAEWPNKNVVKLMNQQRLYEYLKRGDTTLTLMFHRCPDGSIF